MQRKIEELQERLRQLEDAMGLPFMAPPAFRLTRSEEIIVGVLFAREYATRDLLHSALYADRIDGGCELFTVRSMLSKARRKMRPWGVQIICVHDRGYYLPPESKKTISDMLQRKEA